MESNSHSFVVTIWAEEYARPRRGSQLKGHVTHAFTKDRGAVKELTDVLAFMQKYVSAMGVKLGARSRLALLIGAWGQEKRKL